MTAPIRILSRVAVTVLSLLIGVGAAVLVVQFVGSNGGVASGVGEGSATQLLAFIATLAVVGGATLMLGLTSLERSIQNARRKSRRRSR